MAFLRVLLISLAVAAVAATTDLPALPDFTSLPSSCGSVAQVQVGDTCESMAAYAGMDLEKFQALNPLVLCGVLPPQPGSPVCTGDTIAFCNNVYVASQTDTCNTIANTVGTILNIDGNNATTCSDLASSTGVPVCVAPAASPCAVDTLCGVALSQPMQQMLTVLTDYCTIAAECQSGLALTQTVGKPALSLAISAATPAVQSTQGNSGHPELAQFVKNLAAGTNTLTVTFTPDWFTDGSGLTSSEFAFATRRLSRKLRQSSYGPTGKMGTPRYRYYGRK